MGGARVKRLLAATIVMCLLPLAWSPVAHGAPASGTGLSVELTVVERAGTARVAEPVTVGVPLSRAASITGTGGLRVLDGEGRSLPAQFQVTSRWGGAPDDASLPIKWLLVDFQADVGARGSSAYRLVDGGGGPPATRLSVTRDDADLLAVSTGTARFSFSRRRFSLFETVAA